MEEMNNLKVQTNLEDETSFGEQAIIYQEADKVIDFENDLSEKVIIQEYLEEINLGSENLENEIETIESLRLDDLQSDDLEKDNLSIKSEEELIAYYDKIKCGRVVGVYVKVNSNGYITDVANDMFTKHLDGFIKVDEGDGDKFVHAETSYIEDSIIDEFGNYRYKLPNN